MTSWQQPQKFRQKTQIGGLKVRRCSYKPSTQKGEKNLSRIFERLRSWVEIADDENEDDIEEEESTSDSEVLDFLPRAYAAFVFTA